MFKPWLERRIMAPAGEISGGNAPEVKSNNHDLYENGDPNETFDNLDYESETSKKTGEDYKETFKDRIKRAKESKKVDAGEENDDEEEEEKPKKKESKKEDKKEEKKDSKKKSDIDTLSDKSEDEEESEDEDDEEEESPKPKKEEDKKKDEEVKDLDKEKKGKIKVRIGEDLYGLEPESMVRYKVDGEYVERPLQEILNKASGVEALDKKFTDLGKQKKEVELKSSLIEEKAKVLSKTVEQVVNIVKDPNANIWDALEFLVEKSGGDVYSTKRRAMESVLEEVEKLQDMSEAELKAYWLEEKDKIRTKSDAARTKAYEEQQSLIKTVQKVDALRQAHGVSEDQYLKALDDLEADGVDTTKMTDEQIVDYASLKPHQDTVQDVLEPYEAQIDDSQYEDVVRDFAKQLRSKKLTLEQLKEIAKKEFVDEDLKDLTSRTSVKKKTTKTPEKESTKAYESFDDFE